MGKKLQGTARDSWTRILLEYGNLLPHFPGTTLIKPARIPPPPRLKGDPGADALDCFQAYRATSRYYFRSSKQPQWPVRLSELHALPSRAQSVLRTGARVLFESGTQPMVWCAWSMRSWATYGPRYRRGAPPPMGWVFAGKRVAEKGQFFVWDEGGVQSGAKLVFARAHKTLIARYNALRAALMEEHLERGLTEKRVTKIVDEILSDREYAKLLRRAQLQVEERQVTIDQAVLDGEFLWG